MVRVLGAFGEILVRLERDHGPVLGAIGLLRILRWWVFAIWAVTEYTP